MVKKVEEVGRLQRKGRGWVGEQSKDAQVTKAKMDRSLKPARLTRVACSADRHLAMD